MGATDIKSEEQIADELFKSAHSATSAISEWGTRVNTFIKVGGEINELEGVLNKLKIFQIAGGASVLLGLMDGALQLYCLINNIPSKEDLIFKSLNEISSKVTLLSSQLDDMYDKLVKQLKLEVAREELVSDVTFIDELMDRTAQYATRVKNKENTEHLEEEIFGKNNSECSGKQTQLINSSIKLLRASTAKPFDAQTNLMEAVYDSAYGDLGAVLIQGEYLIGYATRALYLYGLLSARMCGEKTPEMAWIYLEGARKDAQTLMNNLSDLSVSVQNYAARCRIEWKKNVTDYINKEFKNEPLIGGPESYFNACTAIGTGLKTHWNWSDWLVIINDAAAGWEQHGVEHNGDIYANWYSRAGPFCGAKVDIIIARADRDSSKLIDKHPLLMNHLPIMLIPLQIDQMQQNFWGTANRGPSNGKLVKLTLENIWTLGSVAPKLVIVQLCWWKQHVAIAATRPERVWLYQPTYDDKAETALKIEHLRYYDVVMMV